MDKHKRGFLFGFPLLPWLIEPANAADPTGSNSSVPLANGAVAGGDLTGTFPNPTVAKVNGTTLANIATSGSANDLVAGTLPGAQMPALGGDLSNAAGTTTVTVSKIGGVSPGPMATAIVGQIPGVATAGFASAGNIGEYLSTSLLVGSAFSISTGAATGIVSLPLSAGDWDVWGQGIVHAGAAITVFTSLTVGISAASNTALPGLTSGAQTQVGLGAGLTGIADTAVNVGPARVSLAAAGTAFLNGSFAFATSTASVYGVMQARRRR